MFLVLLCLFDFFHFHSPEFLFSVGKENRDRVLGDYEEKTKKERGFG